MKIIKNLYVKATNFIACSFMAPHDFNDVLIVRLDELGDFVLWLDSAKEYRNIFPNKKITLMMNEKWVELAKIFDYWDQIIIVDPNEFRFNPIYRTAVLRSIRSYNFETTVSPRYFIQSLIEPAIMRVCGSPNIIVCGGYFPRDGRFTKYVEPRMGTVHELIRNADFIRALGAEGFNSEIPFIPATKSPLSDHIVICPDTLRNDKQWPLKNFIKIMHNLYGQNIVVMSDKKIKGLPSHVYNLTGKTSLIQFIDLINNSKLVIGNDSSCIHLAAALNVPSLCIGVGKHASMFQPYFYEKKREEQVVPRVIWNLNVKSITISEVWNIVKEMV